MKITYQKAQSTKTGRVTIGVELDGRKVGTIRKTNHPGWQYFSKGSRTGGTLFPGGVEALRDCMKSLEETEPRYLGPEASAILAEDSCPGCGNPHHAGSCPHDTPASAKFYQPYQPDDAETMTRDILSRTEYANAPEAEAAIHALAETLRTAERLSTPLSYTSMVEREQTRDNSHLTDTVPATILAAYSEQIGDPYAPKQVPETIDIKPAGCLVLGGGKRIIDAQREWDDATAEFANLAAQGIKAGWIKLNGAFHADDWDDLIGAMKYRNDKQEAFLRAVTGVAE